MITNDLTPTGIPGLDTILNGGLPSERTYLIQGSPGAGKTTMSLQFLLEGVKQCERCLYITLSESREELEGAARSHGWSLEALALVELSVIEDLLEPKSQTTLFKPAEVDLHRTMDRILAEVEKAQAQRIVFDSLTELRLLCQDPLRFRRQLLALKQRLQKKHATVLLLDDRSVNADDLQVQSIVHGVISLERMDTGYGTERRHLRVDKLRGVDMSTGYHDYTIVRGGCRIFPRLVAAEHPRTLARRIKPSPMSSGVNEIDTMLGGGVQRGSSLLLIGGAGTGKSSIATSFLSKAAKEGEKATLWSFEETTDIFFDRAAGLQLDMEPAAAAGKLAIHQVDPAEITPGELAQSVRHEVEAGVKLVVIDSLSGYLNAMPEERHLHLHLHELLSFLNQQGVVTILTLAQHGLIGSLQSTDVSYLADAVMMLRFFEAHGDVKKAISVIKKRTGGHQTSIREFSFSETGLRVGPPLKEFQGVVTGTPTFHGKMERILGETL
jgi:circadian clock protein KaiC